MTLLKNSRIGRQRCVLRRCLVGAVALVAVFLVQGAASAQPADRPTEGRGKGRPIESVGLNLDQAVAESDMIVRGTLSAVRADWVDRKIFTFYDLLVSETIKGDARNQITIAVPGGSKGIVASTWAGAPKFSTGEEVVFFGSQFGPGSSFLTYGLFAGLVKVKTDPSSGQSIVDTRGRPEDLLNLAK